MSILEKVKEEDSEAEGLEVTGLEREGLGGDFVMVSVSVASVVFSVSDELELIA